MDIGLSKKVTLSLINFWHGWEQLVILLMMELQVLRMTFYEASSH